MTDAKLKVILVDDEELARSRLSELLEESGMVEIVGAYPDGESALAALQEMNKKSVRSNDVDLAFLDIELSGMHGLELADRIMDLGQGIQIVFVTGYDEFAIRAFELNAIDYLLKPFSLERLMKSLNRVKQYQSLAALSGDVRILCLGGFAIQADGNFLPVKWRTQKTEELLVLLIVNGNRPINRDRVIELLWPDTALENGMDMLNVTTYNLRKALDVIGMRDCIRTSKREIWLETVGFTCDYLEFEKFARLGWGRRSTELTLNETNIAEAEQLLFTSTGDLFEGKDYLWAEEIRESFRKSYARLAKEVFSFYDVAGDREKAISFLENFLEGNPLQEELQELLIRQYLATGQLEEARIQYERMEKSLAEELGVTPNIRIKALLGVCKESGKIKK